MDPDKIVPCLPDKPVCLTECRMNPPLQSGPRVHELCVTTSRQLFYHPEYGLVATEDPITLHEAAHYGLSPFVLYVLAVAGLRLGWVTFSAIDHLRPLQEVLFEGWTRAEGLRGRPDILRISRFLAKASPALLENMASMGIRVEIVSAHGSCKLRRCQKLAQSCIDMYGPKGPIEGTPSEVARALSQYTQHDHMETLRCARLSTSKSMQDLLAWLSLPVHKPIPPTVTGPDWEPGEWMSSWQATLPPTHSHRYFACRYFPSEFLDFSSLAPTQASHGTTCLLTGEPIQRPDAEDDRLYGQYRQEARVARKLVASWPNTRADIAKATGLSTRELAWFLGGKIPLDQEKRCRLEQLLGIVYTTTRKDYVGSGPHVLIAKGQSVMQAACLSIFPRADALPFEIVPGKGKVDPHWRHMIMYGKREPPCVLLFSREKNFMNQLPFLFMNFAGIHPVLPEFYQDVVATCARACRAPDANIREMTGLWERWHFAELPWKEGSVCRVRKQTGFQSSSNDSGSGPSPDVHSFLP